MGDAGVGLNTSVQVPHCSVTPVLNPLKWGKVGGAAVSRFKDLLLRRVDWRLRAPWHSVFPAAQAQSTMQTSICGVVLCFCGHVLSGTMMRRDGKG